MLNLKTKSAMFESLAGKIICGIMTVIMGFLFIESFMHTMEIVHTEEYFEGILYHNDNFIMNAIYIAAIVLMLIIIIPYLEKIPSSIQMGTLAAITIILGIVWIMSAQRRPSEDSKLLTDAAMAASKNDFSFMSERYFNNFHYQFGFIFFCEILIRLIGRHFETFLYLEIINVILLAASYMGILLILKSVFKSKRIQTIATVMLLFCLQPILYCVFTYGVIPGLVFSIYAVLFEIYYFQSEKKTRYIWALCSVFCIGIAVMIKPNNYIFLVAMMIIAVIKFIRRFSKKNLTDIVYIVAAVLLSCTISNAVCKMYEVRSDIELVDAVPMISFMVMGLNDPENAVGCNAAGWYNGAHTILNHEGHDCDAKKSAAASMEQIKERISFFRENPQEANDFFYEKNMSQWNEPTYASIWINIVRGTYKDEGKIAAYVCGDGSNKVAQYMNVYQMFIFLGAFIGVLICFRKKDIFCSAIILIALGAFLYHMLFEAKSQYILPYFILLCGFSAVGIDYLCSRVENFIKTKFGKKSNATIVKS